MRRVSYWRMFLNTKKQVTADELLKTFFKENKYLKIEDGPNFEVYYKDNTIVADFKCIHEGATWPELAYELVLILQGVSYGLTLTGKISQEVRVFTSNVAGIKGGINALSVSMSKQA